MLTRLVRSFPNRHDVNMQDWIPFWCSSSSRKTYGIGGKVGHFWMLFSAILLFIDDFMIRASFYLSLISVNVFLGIDCKTVTLKRFGFKK